MNSSARGELRGARDLGVARVGPAEADVLARRVAAKIATSCGTSAMRRRSSGGSASRDAHAVERDGAGARDRRSAAADGRSCSCRRPTGRRSRPSRPAARENDTPSSTDGLGPRRIGEAHVLERDLAARRHRQRDRMRRRLDRRLDREQLGQPLGRAGGLRELAPHLAQLAQRARREHRVEHELAERAGASCGRPARPARPPRG